MTRNALAWTQCTARSVRENLRTYALAVAIRASHPRVCVVPALLPVSGLGLVDDGDPLDPLDVLVAVHLRDHDAHRRPVIARERLPVELVGEHRIGEPGLAEAERV